MRPVAARRFFATNESTRYPFHLADKLKHELGFVTPQLLQELNDGGGLCTLKFNGEPGGFLGFRHKDGPTHIYYTAIEEPIRRVLNASAMVTALCLDVVARGNDRIRLYCACDLPANKFWSAIGSELLMTDRGKRKTQRPRSLYRIRCLDFLHGEYSRCLAATNFSTLITSDSSPSVELIWPATGGPTRVGPQSTDSWLHTLEALLKTLPAKLSSNNVAASPSPLRTGDVWDRASRTTGVNSLLPSLSVRPDTTFGYNLASTPRTSYSRMPAAKQECR